MSKITFDLPPIKAGAPRIGTIYILTPRILRQREYDYVRRSTEARREYQRAYRDANRERIRQQARESARRRRIQRKNPDFSVVLHVAHAAAEATNGYVCVRTSTKY
jgi:hypothetical protein